MIGTNTNRSSGFTLLEMLVATGILTVILIIAAGAYSRFARFQRQYSAEQELQEDIRLSLQLFSREARTAFGSTFQVIDGGRGITFRNQERNCVQYWHDSDDLLRRNEHSVPSVDCSELGRYDASKSSVMTDSSDRVHISKMLFKIRAAEVDPADTTRLLSQGIITVIVEAQPNAGIISAGSAWAQPLYLQTAVTSRQLSPYL